MEDFFKYLWYNAKIMKEKPDEETQAAWAKWAQSGYDKYNAKFEYGHDGNIYDREILKKDVSDEEWRDAYLNTDFKKQNDEKNFHASDAHDWNVGQYGFGGRQYGKTEANRRAMERQPKIGKWAIVTPGCTITIDWGEQKRKLLYEKFQIIQKSRSFWKDKRIKNPAEELCLLGTYIFPCVTVEIIEFIPNQ